MRKMMSKRTMNPVASIIISVCLIALGIMFAVSIAHSPSYQASAKKVMAQFEEPATEVASSN